MDIDMTAVHESLRLMSEGSKLLAKVLIEITDRNKALETENLLLKKELERKK